MNAIDKVPFDRLFKKVCNGYIAIKRIKGLTRKYETTWFVNEGHFIQISKDRRIKEDYTKATFCVNDKGREGLEIVGIDMSTVLRTVQEIKH